MSYKVENACSDRLFGSPVRKQIIMFLANKASDDGSGVFCSKGTIARHTELGASTVKRVISEFVAEGILIETGSRPCTNGFTVIYRIDIATVELLRQTKKAVFPTPPTSDPARSGRGTGPRPDGVPVPQRDPNNPNTIHKPPTRKREAVEDLEAEKILSVYPEDRVRDRRTCLDQISAAALGGVDLKDLLMAVEAYATETQGYTRGKVCFSDNWFKKNRWEKLLAQTQADRLKSQETVAKARDNLMGWIQKRHPLCRHITTGQLEDLLAAKLVTTDQIHAAGLRI